MRHHVFRAPLAAAVTCAWPLVGNSHLDECTIPRCRAVLLHSTQSRLLTGHHVVRCQELRALTSVGRVSDQFGSVQPHDIHVQYEFVDAALGQGGFGEVVKAIHKESGLRRAVKRAPIRDSQAVRALAHEVEVLRSIASHENVVKFVDFFDDAKYAYLVMELCTGGDLFDWSEAHWGVPPDQDELARMLLDMTLALHHVHRQGVLHRDVKLENFVLNSEGGVKLIDFGCAAGRGQRRRGTPGSPHYVAPEMASSNDYTEAVDAWALGVSFVSLITGWHPEFKSDYTLDVACVKSLERFSEEALDICLGLLEPNPCKRLTLTQLLDHPFLSKGWH